MIAKQIYDSGVLSAVSFEFSFDEGIVLAASNLVILRDHLLSYEEEVTITDFVASLIEACAKAKQYDRKWETRFWRKYTKKDIKDIHTKWKRNKRKDKKPVKELDKAMARLKDCKKILVEKRPKQ